MTTRTMIVAAGALAVLAGSAAADVVVQELSVLSAATPIAVPTVAGEGVKTIAIGDYRHFNTQGSAFNKVVMLDVGAGSSQTLGSIGWDLSSYAFSPATLADIRITIFNSSGDGITLNPYDAATSGAGTSTSGGMIDLVAMGYDFSVADGVIYIEFHTNSNLLQGAEAAHTQESSISVGVVPAPGSLALMGLGGLAIARRRRR